MKKQLLISALSLILISASCNMVKADNTFTKSLKGIGSIVAEDAKGIAKDIKTSAQKDLENSANASKKSKMAEITKLKNEKLQPIDAEIAAKKKEIAAVKKADILEKERTARLAVLNRQLKYLETKRANVASVYEGKLDALK